MFCASSLRRTFRDLETYLSRENLKRHASQSVDLFCNKEKRINMARFYHILANYFRKYTMKLRIHVTCIGRFTSFQ